jgi:hypothetical protein
MDAPERECAAGLASLGNVNSPPGDPGRYTATGSLITNEEMTSLDHGSATIENCYSRSECDGIIGEIETIKGAGTRCLLDNDWCQTPAASLRKRVASIVPEIGSLAAVQCTFFNKSRANNWFVAFHQDRSIPVGSQVPADEWPGWSRKEGMIFVHGPDELLGQMIALRLHVDDSTTDNGALRVIPDSYRTGTLSPEAIQALRDSSDVRQLTVAKGGVVAMRPLLLHASSKSHTMENRRVLHFLFGPTTLPVGLEWRHAV